jgi:hypothetical protein
MTTQRGVGRHGVRARGRLRWGLTGAAAVLLLTACSADDPPAATPSAPASVPAPEASSSPEPGTTSPSPAPAAAAPHDLAPGDPCDPADGHPDCTDASADGTFRYVEGYAACVEEWASVGRDEAYGLCTDLDGSGDAGYEDEAPAG